MTRHYFGTDGIRGTANRGHMTPETALRAALATGRYFTRGPHRHKVVIGKDTRLSGYMIEPALTAGFVSMGMDVTLLGPVPTPAVAMLTKSLRCDVGVMISASHNPYVDNGIKLFGPDGYKLSDEAEAEIEALMGRDLSAMAAPPEALGRATRFADGGPSRYIEFIKQSFPRHLSLSGLKIVVDCANGAAYRAAPEALYELGAEVITLGIQPNGCNINDKCGSTHPELLQQTVAIQGADFGIALDGDADRLVACDETGRLIDGDQLMALIAKTFQSRNRLSSPCVVATVMSNLALETYLQGRGLELLRTKVGDRYVVETMRARGANLGGEQSGHIVMSDFASTGDGLLAALQVLSVIAEEQRPAGEITRLFDPLPQVLKNIRYRDNQAPLETAAVKQAVAAGERRLGAAGRVLIRKSGTEPLIRVMAEGEDTDLVAEVVDNICHVIGT